jgi:hypothetical protein
LGTIGSALAAGMGMVAHQFIGGNAPEPDWPDATSITMQANPAQLCRARLTGICSERITAAGCLDEQCGRSPIGTIRQRLVWGWQQCRPHLRSRPNTGSIPSGLAQSGGHHPAQIQPQIGPA